jgi:YVTN family beta-propeller protein
MAVSPGLFLAISLLLSASDSVPGVAIPATGQRLTPTAAPGSVFQTLNPHLAEVPDYTAGQAVSTVVSPDGKTLLVLTSGFNRRYGKKHRLIPGQSEEYVFAYDIAGVPAVLLQVIEIPNTFLGIAFSPDGGRFYVGGGVDDSVHAFARSNGAWSELPGAGGKPPFAVLGHACANTLVAPNAFAGAAALCKELAAPGTAGLGVTSDGKLLVIANHENDSVSLVDTRTGRASELDLRPGKTSAAKKGVAGGEYPYWVAIKGSRTAYVSSLRDREVVVVRLDAPARITARIPVRGNPGKMILNRGQTRLYVACDNSDLVTVIDTATNRVIETISTVAPPGVMPPGDEYPGASPNCLALSPDENTLYVTNGALNTLAVIGVTAGEGHRVVGLIPTGWYPNSVSVGNEGRTLYVVNGKSVPGPNPCHTRVSDRCPDENQYILQQEKAGFLTIPVPTAEQLAELTRVAIANNVLGGTETEGDRQLFAALRKSIKHVIYVLKENRTYDQMLGDLPKGNGDPALTEYPRATTPNQHNLATGFVTLDNFYDSGEVSQNGWAWSTAARELDIGVKTTPVVYARRGYTLDTGGEDREVDVGIASPEARLVANPLGRFNPDPDLLPGIGNPTAPDAPPNAQGIFDGGYQQGHLWDSALRAGLTVRNYGFFVDENRYVANRAGHLPGSDGGSNQQSDTLSFIPPYADPAHTDGGTPVAFASDPALAPVTDPYFRGYDNVFPDLFREKEWEREFDGYVDAGTLPNLELVRLPHDHTGDFATALYGVNTPELQQADNDYAVGRLVQKVATSRMPARHSFSSSRTIPRTAGPRGCQPQRGLHRRPFREAGRNRVHALQHGQFSPHHGRRAGDPAPQCLRCPPASDERRVRSDAEDMGLQGDRVRAPQEHQPSHSRRQSRTRTTPSDSWIGLLGARNEGIRLLGGRSPGQCTIQPHPLAWAHWTASLSN